MDAIVLFWQHLERVKASGSSSNKSSISLIRKSARLLGNKVALITPYHSVKKVHITGAEGETLVYKEWSLSNMPSKTIDIS